MNQSIGGRIGNDVFAKPLCGRYSRSYVERAGRFGEHAQRDLRRRTVVGLSQELAMRIEHAHGRAGSGLPRGGNVRTEDPRMPGAKAVGAFTGNTHFGLGNGLFQSNMVADAFPPSRRIFKHDDVIYSGHMINRLSGMRKARGLSAIDLAAQVGVTRQAVYAIEAGTVTPNTAVALRLARALDASVEDLFALEKEENPAAEVWSFEPLDDAFSFEPGEPIQICRVGRRAIGILHPLFPAWLPMADGAVSDAHHATMAGEADDANRLLIAGCDPALSLLARHARETGIEVILANGNSARSLEWLRAAKIDIAGSHLNDPIAGDALFPSSPLRFGKKGSWCGAGIRRQFGVLRISRIRGCDSSIERRDPEAGSSSMRSWKPRE